MFEHLRIQNGSTLKTTVLKDLGKINVICGKNSSGKTTLLECIQNEKTEVGQSITKETDQLKVSGPGYGSAQDYPDLSKEYLNILNNVAARREVWFPGDSNTFIEEVMTGYNSNAYLQKWQFFPMQLASVYKSIFKKYESILISPKRRLEFLKQINTGENVFSEGTGILNYLFHAKNQNETSVDKKIYNQILQAFTNITSGQYFSIEIDKSNMLHLKFSSDQKNWINAQNCGLGLHDLIVILFFAINPDPKYDVVLIEEPENHLHPDMQRKLLFYLYEKTKKQFFITTHSNIFLNSAIVEKVFFTSFKDGAIMIDDASSRASILENLGYSVTDNLVSDLIILVEGPKDKPIIEEFLVKMGLYNQYDIKIWPLGGDIMDQSDMSIFAQKYSILALVDKDPGSTRVRARFIDNCKKNNIEVCQLQRYAIENYFSLRSLKEVFGSQIPDTINELDPNVRLEDQIGIDVKKNNFKLAKKMSLDEIKNTDFFEFLKTVEKKCEEYIFRS